jgi:hypothetical protein
MSSGAVDEISEEPEEAAVEEMERGRNCGSLPSDICI